ncbi:transposase [Sphingobium sp. AN641]|uniref:transposase n=1 Tax=Sphingobium sp. AN641 TaxID=3133443 RepID=UPI0030C6192B
MPVRQIAQCARSTRSTHLRRWVVERTFGWINRDRRLARDFERTIKSVIALLSAAAVIVLIRHRSLRLRFKTGS